MDDIITSIIDIDRNATLKIKQAEEQKLKIISDARADEESIIAHAVKQAENEFERMELEEKNKADERIAQLRKDKDEKIIRMKKQFADNSEKWCSEIFNSVINV